LNISRLCYKNICSRLIFLTILVVLYTPAFTQDEEKDKLPFPIDKTYDPTQNKKQSFDLGDPSSVKQTIVYDPITKKYVFKEVFDNSNLNYRNPSMMTLEEYLDYEQKKSISSNWKEKVDEQTDSDEKSLVSPIKVGGKGFINFFGSDEISIKPQGSVEVSLGVNSSRYDNPILPVKQRKVTRFDFQQNLQINLVGQIGTKLKLSTSYNSQAAFDFENVTKLGYTGDEDQILQKIELGNVSMPLNTSLIQGSQTLFGVKTQLKFGRLTVDNILASSKGKKQEINIAGKAKVQNFELTADNYEANRHYFISHYFRDMYDTAMSSLPIVNSQINITRMEVWLTNRINSTVNTRNVIAFTDLGEAKQENTQGNPSNFNTIDLPQNNSNGLYDWLQTQDNIKNFSNAVPTLNNTVSSPGPFTQAVHYEKIENARKLSEQEYSYNALLGYISLNQPLNNDEILAVCFEYTYQGKTYQVGQFSTDGVSGSEALFLKLLKPTLTNPKNKIWDLMMKNVYSIGAYQLDNQGFRMDVLYNNPATSLPVNFFPYDGLDKEQLVSLLGMDKMNVNYQPFSDGLFDFAPVNFNGNRAENGGTINPKNGRVYFSTIEPFGKTLRDKMLEKGIAASVVDKIAFTELYDSTKTAAQQLPAKNRFLFRGQYQSSVSSDIPLNALNVPQGAVSVTAGGIKLIEGTDYTVDYNLGRVKILNSGVLESNTPIKISIESNSVFGFQARSMIGTHLNYRFSQDFNLGATWMRMTERPITQKVDMGTEPFKNNVIGMDISFKHDLPFLTKMIDFLPFISTRAKSSISLTGEVAHLIPGSPKAISKAGISYVDDFEGSQSTIDLRTPNAWKLASIPQGQPNLFPEADKKELSAGFNRSTVAWYLIDPIFYQNSSLTPQNVKDDPTMLSDSRMRMVNQKDIFPNLQQQYGSFTNIPILELAYYPKERGMYNFDTLSPLDKNGLFTNPQKKWGGIMRALSTNDFELTNIEFIQFWILDPFNEDAEAQNPNSEHTGGDLYFNLGNISEDILPDSRKEFENGLPSSANASLDNLDTTAWARVSTQNVVVNAFDSNPESLVFQDIGLDGWNNTQEKIAYQNYVNWINNNPTLSAETKERLINDPSGDDYKYYRDDQYDADKANILTRYKRFNRVEGNSPSTAMSANINAAGYPTQATNYPDVEDLNQDNNLSESESYYQYKVSLRKHDLEIGKNNITNIQEYKNGNKIERWIQFKIPVREPNKVVNGITDFRSIRFMRMFLTGFEEEVLLRFARLEFIRGEWRKYLGDINQPGEVIQTDPNLTTFNISAVNIEENSERSPIKYQIPPGIIREIDPSQVQQRQMNEQALSLEVCNLQDGEARAAYKNVQFDVRTYKKLKMFVHAEEVSKSNPLNNGDVTLFVRIGADFTDNYYEYEMPLTTSPWGTSSPEEVWPDANNMEIDFDNLLLAKKKRNTITASAGSNLSNTSEFVMVDPSNATRKIKVKGSPNLQDLKTILIGVRNPSKSTNKDWTEDGLPKCATIWINELRLTDFQNEGGSAAVGRVQIQAADFATVSVSGNYSGINWGSIESRVQERQRNEQIGFDFNTTMQLGQFLGKRLNIALPFFYGYSLGIINPEYDPFNPDIRLNDYSFEEKREKAKLGQDFTERKSYNFTNVRKEANPDKKPMPWNISNFAASYGYTENLKRDFNLEYDRTKSWKSTLTYNYSFTAKPIEPFKKVKFMQKSNWWGLIRDANFYLTPKTIAFNNDILRNYNERKVRNNLAPTYEFDPVYVKSFTWNRSYNLGYDITKNLKFTFSANDRAIFDEANGRVDKKNDPLGYQIFLDTINSQLKTWGKNMDYTHNYSLNYNLPLDKIPALDWINASAKYSGTYNWQRAPLGQSQYGNTIQNSRVVSVNSTLNFTSLYNKNAFFKKVLSANTRQRAQATKKNASTGNSKKQKRDPNATSFGKPYDQLTAREQRKEDRIRRREERQEIRAEKKAERQKRPVNPIVGTFARAFMSVRSVSGNYSINDGTILPGYNQEARFLGSPANMPKSLSSFLMGQQNYDIYGKRTGYDFAKTAAERNWLVKNSALNKQHTQSHSQNITGRVTVEPLKDVSIEFSFNRNYTINANDYFRWSDSTQQYESQSLVETGTLTYSTISLNSAFNSIGKDYSTASFTKLRDSREDISSLLGNTNSNSSKNSNGYYTGYGETQQEVLIGAFLTSYTNNKQSDRNINPVSALPLPNWSINYSGFMKFELVKKYAKNFVVRHNYSSSISISGIQTNLQAKKDANGNSYALDLNNNFIADKQIQNVGLSERFSPLFGLDAIWKFLGQGLITKVEYKKDRNASLALTNQQITEILGKEWVIGSGVKFSKVKMPFKLQGKVLENDLNVRFDFSFRDNFTIIRKIVENTNQATAGQKVVSIKSSIDYNLGPNLTMMLYYDQVINTPKVATSYPTGNTSAGFKLRLNLAGM
jgi:cell surface protein SprA